MTLGATPSQTVGPYFAIGLAWADGIAATQADAAGAITIGGQVLDGHGDPVPDALIETWQISPPASDTFRAFTRAGTDQDGRYGVVTLKPEARDGQAPHLVISVFGRGMLQRVVSRIYFSDEPESNAADPVLASVPAERRPTLLAQPVDGGYRFDIRLQGADETVFFAG